MRIFYITGFVCTSANWEGAGALGPDNPTGSSQVNTKNSPLFPWKCQRTTINPSTMMTGLQGDEFGKEGTKITWPSALRKEGVVYWNVEMAWFDGGLWVPDYEIEGEMLL